MVSHTAWHNREQDLSKETLHYLELPLLLSLKFSAFSLNAGPYLGILIDGFRGIMDGDGHGSASDPAGDDRVGLSVGIGFDMEKFYIGAFYDYDEVNRTLGFNVGVNL